MTDFVKEELGAATIYFVGAIEFLRSLANESVDFVFTDPPYGVSNKVGVKKQRNPRAYSASMITDFTAGEWDLFESQEAFWKFTGQWVDECARILRPGGTFFSYFDREQIGILVKRLKNKHQFILRNYVAWIKTNPVPNAQRVNWMNGWEEGVVLQKPGKLRTYNYALGQQVDYFLTPIVGGAERLGHPTQKPESMTIKIMGYWSNENDLVVDPFVGSGTTAAISLKMGRRFAGAENKQEYFDMAVRRLEPLAGKNENLRLPRRIKSQPRLFIMEKK